MVGCGDCNDADNSTVDPECNAECYQGKEYTLFQGCSMAVIAACNVLLTILLVNLLSYVGAAISTACAITIGNIVILNIYYQRVIGLNIKRMFSGIGKGILPCLLLTSVFGFFVRYIPGSSWMIFLTRAFLFLAVYSLLLNKYGIYNILPEEASYCLKPKNPKVYDMDTRNEFMSYYTEKGFKNAFKKYLSEGMWKDRVKCIIKSILGKQLLF